MKDRLEHVSYGMGFSVTTDVEPKTFGPVRVKSGRIIYRNYRRVIRPGLSLLDLCRIRANEVRVEMERLATESFK